MQHLITELINKQHFIKSNTATIGFDGFVDTIVSLIRAKDNTGKPVSYFNTMAGWGNYILSKQGSNFSIELTQHSIKAGGNTPNMAHALSMLGLTVNCVGALGYPSVYPIFSSLAAQCHLYSFANPGDCRAVEFDDGKMMLAEMEQLNKVNWNTLVSRIPVKTLIEIFDAANLIGLLNWGELEASTGFWEGVLRDVLPFCSTGRERIIFIDLSDCSGRTTQETLAAIELMKKISNYGRLILSLNRNESLFIHSILCGPVTEGTDLKTLGEQIFSYLKPDTLLLHQRNVAAAFRKNEFSIKNSAFIESPKLLTGAGDNFNAGFCFAQLMDCCLEDSLTIAHLLAGCYIKNGESPDWNELTAVLKTV